MSIDSAVVAAVCAAYVVVSRSRKRRRLWQKEFFKSRQNNMLRELEWDGEVLFSNFTRMSRQDFDVLLEKVRPLICKQDTVMREAIPAETRLLLTLRFLATGDSYHSLKYLFKVSVQSISVIIPETVKVTIHVLREYIKMPSSEEEWNEIASTFEAKWNHPNCCGAVDGKHVVIQCPEGSATDYYNYKGCYSIVLLGVVDADYNFIYCNVGCKGKISDGGVFKHSEFAKKLFGKRMSLPNPRPLRGRNLDVPFVLVADDAFPLHEHIMKPFPVELGKGSPNRVFNYRLSRARRTVENAFGLLASVFRIFRKPIEMKNISNVADVVLCCVYLHNFLRKQKSSRTLYAPCGSLDSEDASTGNVIDGLWRQTVASDTGILPLQTRARKPSARAHDIRIEFREYFMSRVGSVPWQHQYL